MMLMRYVRRNLDLQSKKVLQEYAAGLRNIVLLGAAMIIIIILMIIFMPPATLRPL